MKRKRIAELGCVCVMSLLLLAGAACGKTQERQISDSETENKKDGNQMTDFHEELFGDNVYIFSPEDDPGEVNQVLKELWEQQETNQFGEERYAVCFLPGEYDESIEGKVGFYTQVLGLGKLPTDTNIASLNCDATWLGDDPTNHNACCNFWRGIENIEIGSNTMWAVSQATSMRRTKIDGALYLHDNYGWCSGGFLADTKVELMTDSGSQQQWLSRNCDWKQWMGSNWNMVFVGTEDGKAPEGAWPGIPYTEIEQTKQMREKPFLIYDEKEGYQVFVPNLEENTSGVSWENGQTGEALPLDTFYVAHSDLDTAETMNEALSSGKNLLLTPGVYRLEEPIQVNNPNTIVLGLGLATLQSTNGNECMITANESGIIIAGILFDAGETESENLLVVGTEAAKTDDIENSKDEKTNLKEEPILLSDLYFRVGGTDTKEPCKTKNCLTINSSQVIGDNFWVWRADHGDQVAWNKNTADTGIVVNGDNVAVYGLMVEHFQKYQTIWNGNGGSVYLYQSEIPYDVPNQEAWMSMDGTKDGYASFKVCDEVTDFKAYGLGIYLYNRDATVNLESAMEVPDTKGVSITNLCTVMLTGHPGMNHMINESGGAVQNASERQVICEYEAGLLK